MPNYHVSMIFSVCKYVSTPLTDVIFVSMLICTQKMFWYNQNFVNVVDSFDPFGIASMTVVAGVKLLVGMKCFQLSSY